MQPYYFHPDQPLTLQFDSEMQKYLSCQNYSEIPYYPQFSYPPAFPGYQVDYTQDQEIANAQKIKKPKKNKNIDSKGLLPKTLESEKQIVDDPAQTQPQNEQIAKHIAPYPIFHFPQGAPIPKLQSDIVSNQEVQGSVEGSQQTQKQKGQHQQTKKPKKEHINTGHWSTEEHSTYINFLQQYESIMTSSMMKKTSKIFKQMSELIGTRTPSQCRSHHQKFNPYALRGENGKRLPRTERSRAGRKKKNPQSEIPKAEEASIQQHYDQDQLMMMYDKHLLYSSLVPFDQQWNSYLDLHQNIKKEEEYQQEMQHSQLFQQQQIPPQEYEEYLRINFQRNQANQDYIDVRNSIVNDY